MKTLIVVVLSAMALLSVFSLHKAGAEEYTEARSLVQERCSTCHNLGRVERRIGEFDAEAWNDYVVRMQNLGARVSDSERETIVGFLASLESAGDLK